LYKKVWERFTNMDREIASLVWFYNQRAAAENLIKEANNSGNLTGGRAHLVATHGCRNAEDPKNGVLYRGPETVSGGLSHVRSASDEASLDESDCFS
jgi:hypothetical protein